MSQPRNKTRETEIALLTEKLHSAQAQLVQSAKMATLGKMAGSIAHEINNPLSILKLKLDLVSNMVQESPTNTSLILEELAKIIATTDRISNVVRGLKSYSRKSEDDPFISIDLYQVIKDTMELCKDKFKYLDINVRINCPSEAVVQCRPSQISQVLLNCLNNAYDAISEMDQKWVEISVSKIQTYFEISITDSGNGIPDSVAKKMMQPFFTTKSVDSGTGLGLSLSKDLIEGHSGRFFYDSSHKNTRFVIQIPIHQDGTTKKAV